MRLTLQGRAAPPRSFCWPSQAGAFEYLAIRSIFLIDAIYRMGCDIVAIVHPSDDNNCFKILRPTPRPQHKSLP